MKTTTYVIRIGDGNDGTFARATTKAPDAFEALRIGTRYFGKPKDARHQDAEGDELNATLCSYVAPIYGDACRWVMDAQPLEDCAQPVPSLDITPSKYANA